MATTLELKFLSSEGKVRTLNVAHPILDITPEQVQAAMGTIIAQDMFVKDGVKPFTQVNSARYVERNTTDILSAE
ncbi:DUF2922 domain-containing protein [Lacticigenium naphthae]|uniref:DUF2922 domain-containing protein n=1 Tax=Lacticigenium naphthae TaxID=515351 RepID=UPI000428FEF1|nr:DUF2922 domain-containing protein [Lacticigenium naphthae]